MGSFRCLRVGTFGCLLTHGARLDGTQNALVLAFALPAGSAPAVELIDVAGRRLERQTLTGLDPGEHAATVPVRAYLPAGVYFVRLIQGGQVRVAKTALLR